MFSIVVGSGRRSACRTEAMVGSGPAGRLTRYVLFVVLGCGLDQIQPYDLDWRIEILWIEEQGVSWTSTALLPNRCADALRAPDA